jgi:hypothetical protein
MWQAVMEARMRQAERELSLHSHLIPEELRRAGERVTERREKDLPFTR